MTRLTPLVAAVDVGSSSVRAAVHDVTGRVRRGTFVQVPYALDVDGRGSATVPWDRLFGVVERTLDGLVARAGRDLDRVVAVGTSCFLHSIAAVDAAGNPVSPLLTWADTTAAADAAGLRRLLDPDATWQLTGAPIHASYWPAKMARLVEAAAGGAIAGFAGAPDLLWKALTGRDGMDVSHASGTGLLQRSACRWHEPLLRAVGAEAGALPPVLTRWEAAGLSPVAARRWPALAGVAWYAPWSDASCGNVGLGATPGRGAALQIGTSGAIRVIVDREIGVVPAGLFAHRLVGRWALLGGQLSEGGGTAAAVARLLGGTVRGLDAEASRLPPDGHGLTVLPFLSGERGPGYHEAARGVVAGLSLATTPADVYLATVESIGLRFALLDRRLAAYLGATPSISAAGGALARSRLLPAVLAAALDRPIQVSSEPEPSLRGAALLALAASGVIPGPDAVPPPPSVSVEPDPARATAYRRAADRHASLYGALIEGG